MPTKLVASAVLATLAIAAIMVVTHRGASSAASSFQGQQATQLIATATRSNCTNAWSKYPAQLWDEYCNGKGWQDTAHVLSESSIALSADCTQYGEAVNQNAVSEAVAKCEAKAHAPCFTFDVNRDTCFSCNATHIPAKLEASWAKYCHAPGVKSFAMSRDCRQGAFSSNGTADSKERAITDGVDACNADGSEPCAVFSVDGGGCPNSAGSCDFRSRLPTCLQIKAEWCWATAVAEVARFYGYNASSKVVATKFLNASRYTDEHCGGVECLIAGETFFPNATNTCCANEGLDNVAMKTCDQGGTGPQVVDAIQNLTGVRYKTVYTAVSPSELDAILCAGGGSPVIVAVGWQGPYSWCTGGHALTLGGTNGRGKYYLHDPMDRAQHYQTVSYEELMHYIPPEANGGCWGEPEWVIIPAAA